MTPDHLHPKIRHYLDACVTDRVSYIRRDRFVPYQRADTIISEMDAIMLVPAGVPAQCLLVIAEPGMGKTTLLDFAGKRYGMQEKRPLRCDYVRINLPQIVNDRRLFYKRILKQLGTPFRLSDKPDFLHEQVVDALRDSETRLLAIDEFHNFLGSNVKHLQEHMIAIRDIANIPLSIVGAGTRAAESCVKADDQLDQRFARHHLNPWGETEELRNFLATLESRIPLRSPSNLAKQEMVTLLVRLSNGHMRQMINLIKKSAEWAVTGGTETISRVLLQEALRELARTSNGYGAFPSEGREKPAAESTGHG